MPLLRAFWLTAVVSALACLGGVAQVRADALRKVEREASGDRSDDRPARTSRSRGDSSAGGGWSSHERESSGEGAYEPKTDLRSDLTCMDEGGCPAGWFLRQLMRFTLLLPFSLPRAFDDPSRVGYAARPFASGPGLMASPVRGTLDAADDARRVLLAVDAESGFLLEGVVPTVIGMRLGLPHRFELDVRSALLSDVYEQPAQLAASATSHVTYRFAQGPRFAFRAGAGARLFSLDRVQGGIDLTYAADAYLARRLLLRVELHAGTLGDALAAQARATLGVMLCKAELYAGYDHTVFHRDSNATLGGPIVGLRAWF